MSDDYQVRKDIDRLQSTMYETGSDQLKLATKEELEAYQDEVDKRFYDVGQIDETVEEANNLIDNAKKDLNDFKIEAQNALSELTSDKVNVSDFEVYQGQVTSALSGKSDEGHKHPISDVNDLQTTLDGKAPKNHRSTATTYGVSTATYYGHSKASNSTPSADTVNGSSGTVNGIYANANHTHPRSSIYAQASHQHDASDVLYTIKDELLWTLINTTIDKNLNGETLTGIYSLVNTEFNLSTAQSTSHTNNKYYIVYANTTTDITSALSTGIDVSADIEDVYIKEMLDTKRNISDWVEATDVRVRVGTLQNDAQTMFNNILYWQSQHEDSGGSSYTGRCYSTSATWRTITDSKTGNDYSTYRIVDADLPDEFQQGDILVISFPLETGSSHQFPNASTYDGTIQDSLYFLINRDKHYCDNETSSSSDDDYLWYSVSNYSPLVLICQHKDYSSSDEMWYCTWSILYNDWAWSNIWDFTRNVNRLITNKVSTVSTITLNSYATLYVNEATHNCELYYTRSFANATANTKYTWHSNLIDEKYRPPYEVFGLFEPYGYLYVDTNGTVSGKFPNGFSTRTTTYGRVRWSY